MVQRPGPIWISISSSSMNCFKDRFTGSFLFHASPHFIKKRIFFLRRLSMCT